MREGPGSQAGECPRVWPTRVQLVACRSRRHQPWPAGAKTLQRQPAARGSPRDRLPTRRRLLLYPSRARVCRRRVRWGIRRRQLRWHRRVMGRQPGRRRHKHHDSPTNPRPLRPRSLVRSNRLRITHPKPRVIRLGISNLRPLLRWVRPARTPRPPRRRWPGRWGRQLIRRHRPRSIVGLAHLVWVRRSCRHRVPTRGMQRPHPPLSFPSSIRRRRPAPMSWPLAAGSMPQACREVWSQTFRRQP